jgi:flagellar basal-body rod modification protein FlgD
MSIAALTTSASDSSSKTSTTNTSSAYNLDADDFMTLLLAQLENQDPSDPTDMDTFTSQLCSLNQLQQATETNEYLDHLVTNSDSQAINYIGKTIAVEGDGVSVSDGTAHNLAFNLGDDASDVAITIYDENGDAVRTIELSVLDSGVNSIGWDGKDDDGDTLDDGAYTFQVSAADSSGNSLDVTTYSLGQVTGVVYEDGTPYLIAKGEEISLDDVACIYQS